MYVCGLYPDPVARWFPFSGPISSIVPLTPVSQDENEQKKHPIIKNCKLPVCNLCSSLYVVDNITIVTLNVIYLAPNTSTGRVEVLACVVKTDMLHDQAKYMNLVYPQVVEAA